MYVCAQVPIDHISSVEFREELLGIDFSLCTGGSGHQAWRQGLLPLAHLNGLICW